MYTITLDEFYTKLSEVPGPWGLDNNHFIRHKNTGACPAQAVLETFTVFISESDTYKVVFAADNAPGSDSNNIRQRLLEICKLSSKGIME